MQWKRKGPLFATVFTAHVSGVELDGASLAYKETLQMKWKIEQNNMVHQPFSTNLKPLKSWRFTLPILLWRKPSLHNQRCTKDCEKSILTLQIYFDSKGYVVKNSMFTSPLAFVTIGNSLFIMCVFFFLFLYSCEWWWKRQHEWRF